MSIKKAPIILFCIARIIPQLDPTCYAFVHFTLEPLSQKNHLYHCVRITQLKDLKTLPTRHVGDKNT